MPALLPALLASSQLWLAADRVPQLNIAPSCHAVATISKSLGRSEDNCLSDERAAHAKLKTKWSSFDKRQRTHCVQLSTLGGYPSYVELLTCLELGKAAKDLPAEARNDSRTFR